MMLHYAVGASGKHTLVKCRRGFENDVVANAERGEETRCIRENTGDDCT